jgi:hypothetical protein
VRYTVDFAASPAASQQLGNEGVAALHYLAGEYYGATRSAATDAPLSEQAGAAADADKQYAEARGKLDSGLNSGDRDALLSDLALGFLDLEAKSADEVRDKVGLDWKDVLKRLQSTLGMIHAPEARLNAFRLVCRRLLDAGKPDRVGTLAAYVFSGPEEAAGKSTASIILLDADQKQLAEPLARSVFKLYAKKEDRPPLVPGVVTLALMLNEPPPEPAKKAALEEKWDSLVGEAEGLARLGRWPDARQIVADAQTPTLKLRTAAALLIEATRQKRPDAADLFSALPLGDEEVRQDKFDQLRWVLLRLVQAGVDADQSTEALDALAKAIAEPNIRGRAQLAVLRSRLAVDKSTVETNWADKVEPKSVAHGLAWAAIARHNSAISSGYLATVRDWPEPWQAFGSIGAARGLLPPSK